MGTRDEKDKMDEQALGACCERCTKGKCATKVGKTWNGEFEPIWWTIVAALTKFSWSGAQGCRFPLLGIQGTRKKLTGKSGFGTRCLLLLF
jgi:hypothetical protein